MHLAAYTSRLRRGSAFAALVVLLGVVAMTLSQCRMVDERLTGVSYGKNAPENCFARCSHAFNDSIRVESVLHVDNVHACAGDSLCLALEEMRHEAAVDRIQMGRQACQEGCHHQGSGGGGR